MNLGRRTISLKTHKGRLAFVCACLLPLLIAGCDGSAPPSPPISANSGPAVRGDGIVSGRVTLTGFTPSRKTQVIQCGAHQHPIPDETVVMGENNALSNVVVYVKEAPHSGPVSLPPAVLDQVNCRYIPHVLAVQAGQTVQVKSSDDTLHNVHTLSERNRNVNFGMSGRGSKDLRFDHPEFFRVKCDVHPWMNAHIAVIPHPYFAVTGSDGAFAIPNLPAGTYTLIAWHEKFDILEQQITIDESKPLEVHFRYEPPAQ